MSFFFIFFWESEEEAKSWRKCSDKGRPGGGTLCPAREREREKGIYIRWPRLFGCCGPPKPKKQENYKKRAKGFFFAGLVRLYAHTHTHLLYMHVHTYRTCSYPRWWNLTEYEMNTGERAAGRLSRARPSIYLSIYIYKTPFFSLFSLVAQLYTLVNIYLARHKGKNSLECWLFFLILTHNQRIYIYIGNRNDVY